jgi:FAD/FMN-containing dehydrogenase
MLSLNRIRESENFGHSIRRSAYHFEINNSEDIKSLFKLAQSEELSIAPRGNGRSYGDASLNGGQILIDLLNMNQIINWDPEHGLITVEPGLTIEQLWKHVLGDDWWPPVVPGTMTPTIGGCLASNIHGKNNWVAGTLGEHVVEFEALLPSGEKVACSPRKNKDLFEAMIGGMGMLGIFTSITLQLKSIRSGEMDVLAWAEPNLAGMLDAIDANKTADYVVGWLDCTQGGKSLGRGQIHRADYVKFENDPDPTQSLRVDHQSLPNRIAGLIPRKLLYKLLAPLTNNLGTRLINFGRYFQARVIQHNHNFRQSLVAFSFLLDYVPNWERAYGPGGLIQFQSFVPKNRAEECFRAILEASQALALPPYLGVVKRHRPDPFLLSHSVDGFSMALDFKVTSKNRTRLLAHLNALDAIVIEHGGRFYFAKDSHLSADSVKAFLGKQTVNKFRALKATHDPHNLLQSDMYRRCFGSPHV